MVWPAGEKRCWAGVYARMRGAEHCDQGCQGVGPKVSIRVGRGPVGWGQLGIEPLLKSKNIANSRFFC